MHTLPVYPPQFQGMNVTIQTSMKRLRLISVSEVTVNVNKYYENDKYIGTYDVGDII